MGHSSGTCMISVARATMHRRWPSADGEFFRSHLDLMWFCSHQFFPDHPLTCIAAKACAGTCELARQPKCFGIFRQVTPSSPPDTSRPRNDCDGASFDWTSITEFTALTACSTWHLSAIRNTVVHAPSCCHQIELCLRSGQKSNECNEPACAPRRPRGLVGCRIGRCGSSCSDRLS